MGSRHEKYSWEPVQEHNPYPGRHAVSPRGLEVPVDDDHCYEYRDDVHDESEEEVLGDEGDCDGCGGEDLRD